MNENNAAQAVPTDWSNGLAVARRAPLSGLVVLESATVLAIDALLSKLRAPVVDEQVLPTSTAWRDPIMHAVASLAAAISLLERTPKAKKAAASDAMFAQMLRDYRAALDNARAALAGAPVAEPETMEEIHRRERERAPWVLPKDPTLPASAPDTSEADASPIVPGGPYSDPEQFIASLGASAPVAGYIKPDPAAPTHPRYVSELKYRSAADAEADPEGKGWLKVYAGPQARPSDDKLWDQTLGERDEYHDMADKLANAIADHLLIEIGEHTSSNCPWTRALEAIENAAPQASAETAIIGLSERDRHHVREFINCDGLGSMVVEGPRYSAVVRALKTQADKDGGQQRAGDVVEVCPDCDIAGCQHIRASAALSATQAEQGERDAN